MDKSKRAHSVVFGFDFQVNAAIVLMLENVLDMCALRLEGNHEDIDLELADGNHILAQAKSVVESSSDFRNVRKNLRNALKSLSLGAKGVNVEELILITNSPNPFDEDISKGIFLGPPAHRSYSSLPPSTQKIIDTYLTEISDPLDLSKFSIQTLPFETDIDSERYKYVAHEIENFIGRLDLNISGLGQKILGIWHWDIFVNGTKKDATIRLKKKDIMWPIMVIATDINRCDDEFLEQFEPGDYDEIVHHYEATINSCCERYEFFVRVLTDYNNYQHTGSPSKRCLDFVEDKWKDYFDEFSISGIDEEIQVGLTKIVLYNIVRRRRAIEKIKRGTNL